MFRNSIIIEYKYIQLWICYDNDNNNIIIIIIIIIIQSHYAVIIRGATFIVVSS